MSLCFAIISIGAATKIALEAKHASVVSIDVNSLVNFALLGYGGVIGLSASRPAPKWLIGGTAQCVVFCLYLLSATALGSRPDVWPLFGRLGAVMVGVLLFQIFHGQQTWFVAILQTSLLQKMGRISYGAYLIHNFVHFSMIDNLLQVASPRPVQVLGELTASLILAAISWRYFEGPIIAWAARVTSQSPGTAAGSTASSRTAARPS